MKTFFNFHGSILPSKSLYNRALILQSFLDEETFRISNESLAEDVQNLKNSLWDFKQGKREFHCGDGGTTLRFLALRLSRESGSFILHGSPRLFERPQQELQNILKLLGVRSELNQQSFVIHSSGWKINSQLVLRESQSSQFASAVALSSYGLDLPLEFLVPSEIANYGYFSMTLRFLEAQGAKTEVLSDSGQSRILISPWKITSPRTFEVEADMSSAFPIAVLGALLGKARLTPLFVTENSLQPDISFINILKMTGVRIIPHGNELSVLQTASRNCGIFDLTQTPDLFPVLASYLSFCEGKSILTGLERLEFKESNRIEKTRELLDAMNVDCTHASGEFTIDGKIERTLPVNEPIGFDPDKDHRMAMAASIFQCMGANLSIKDSSVVNKSFPNYFEILQASLR